MNIGAVLVTNAFTGCLSAPLTLFIAQRSGLQLRWAIVAAVIVALDPPSIIYSAYLGSEALANTFSAAALCVFLIGVTEVKYVAAWGIGSGILLVLSAYARPASYLLWVPLGLGVILIARKHVRFAVSFMIVSALGIGIWGIHNGVVFGNPTFSTIGVYNLLYYRAASVEYQSTNHDLDTIYRDLSIRVETILGRDTSLVNSDTRHGHYAATADLQNAMQIVAFDVFTSHPLQYLMGIPVGLLRILIVVDGLSPWVAAAAALWNASLLTLALVGFELARRRRAYQILGAALLICAYFILGTLVVQTSGIDVRASTMLTPILASAAAFALSRCSRSALDNLP